MMTSKTIIDGGILSGVPHALPGGRVYVIQRSRVGYRAAILNNVHAWTLDRPANAYDDLSPWLDTHAEATAWALAFESEK